MPLAPVLLGPTSRVRVASTVSPSFFLRAPEMAPRMVRCCQPVAAAICLTVALLGALEQLDHLRLLGAGAQAGSFCERGPGLPRHLGPSPWPLPGLLRRCGRTVSLGGERRGTRPPGPRPGPAAAPVSARAQVLRHLRFDPDGAHALAGDDHPLGSAVATEDPDCGRGCGGCPSPVLEGTALEVEASGSGRDWRGRSRWAAAPRMTSWVSLSLGIG